MNVLPDRVISSGRHIRDHLVDVCGCRAEKQVSIPAGADAMRFHPEVDASAVRSELGLGPSDRVVGMVAVLRSWKGHRVFLEACVRLRTRVPGLKVLVVGDGPMRGAIDDWVAQLNLGDIVRRLGHREDIPELMKAMNVCVLPS